MPDNEIRDHKMKRCNERIFRRDHTRKAFFKSKFDYVESIYLGIDTNGKERFFHYTPIQAAVKALLNQISAQEQYIQAKSDTPVINL